VRLAKSSTLFSQPKDEIQRKDSMKGPTPLEREIRNVRMGGPIILAAPGQDFTIPIIIEKGKGILSFKLIGLPPADMIESYEWVLGPSAPKFNLEINKAQLGFFDLDVWSLDPLCDGTAWVLNFNGKLSPDMEQGDIIQFPITGLANEAKMPLAFEPLRIEVI
jgi:hypothetical protein